MPTFPFASSLILVAAAAVVISASCASGSISGAVDQSTQPPTSIWQLLTEPPPNVAMRAVVTGPHAIFRFNREAFERHMDPAGRDNDPNAAGVVILLPMPDGRFKRFLAKESPMLAPELASAFPDIRTYSGQGLEDRTATTRFGWTAAGFHAIILAGGTGNVHIDTYAPTTLDVYVSYRR